MLHLLELAYQCVKLSMTAYGAPAINYKVERYSNYNAQWVRSSNILAIAGTNDLFDIADDTLAVSSYAEHLREGCNSFYRQLKVHAGFLRHATFVAEKLENASEIKYICGHSLGAAVAAILPLIVDDLNPIAIPTFGGPKFLKRDCAAYYDLPLHRFVNTQDPVPLAPYFTYAHVGTARFINRHKQMVMKVPWIDRMLRLKDIRTWNYHDRNMYQKDVRALCQNSEH